MKVSFLDLKKPYNAIDEEINNEVLKTLRSGWYVLGENLKKFEEAFAKYCGVKYAVGVGSGTDAIQLALTACGFNKDEEAITVPNTAVPTATAITAAGGYPCFVDIDEKTFNMSSDALKYFLEKNTKYVHGMLINKNTGRTISAVVPVHLYGQCADLDPILEICDEYGLKVIEDCAQAHGALYKNKMAGTFGNAGAYSFYPTKNLGASGDAGAIITNSEELYEKFLLLRNYGQKDRYVHKTSGINSRLDEIQAAILLVKLKYLDSWNEKRRKMSMVYRDLLKDLPVILPHETENNFHVYHLFVIRAKDRENLRHYLHKNGVETNIHYPIPIHLQESYSGLNISKGSYPTAEKVSDEIVSLPFSPFISIDEAAETAKFIKEFYIKKA